MMRGKAILTVILVMVVSAAFFSAYAIEKKTTLPKDKTIKPTKTVPKGVRGGTDIREGIVRMIRQFRCDCDSSGWVTDVHNRCFVFIDVRDSDGLGYVEIQFDRDQVFRVNRPGNVVTRTVIFNLRSHRPTRSGKYPLNLIAEDTLGNVETRTTKLLVDLEPPSFTVERPCGGDVIYTSGTEADVTFEITVSDDFSGVQAVNVSREWGRVLSDRTRPYRITVRDVPCGEHEFRVTAVDNADNARQVTVNFAVRHR